LLLSCDILATLPAATSYRFSVFSFVFQRIRQDLSSVEPRFISASCGHHLADLL